MTENPFGGEIAGTESRPVKRVARDAHRRCGRSPRRSGVRRGAELASLLKALILLH
jgi:hypothetical protein